MAARDITRLLLSVMGGQPDQRRRVAVWNDLPTAIRADNPSNKTGKAIPSGALFLAEFHSEDPNKWWITAFEPNETPAS